MALLWSFTDIHRVEENLSHPVHSFPAEAEQGEALPSFSSHAVNSYPFHSVTVFSVTVFSVTSFAFLCSFFFFFRDFTY